MVYATREEAEGAWNIVGTGIAHVPGAGIVSEAVAKGASSGREFVVQKSSFLVEEGEGFLKGLFKRGKAAKPREAPKVSGEQRAPDHVNVNHEGGGKPKPEIPRKPPEAVPHPPDVHSVPPPPRVSVSAADQIVLKQARQQTIKTSVKVAGGLAAGGLAVYEIPRLSHAIFGGGGSNDPGPGGGGDGGGGGGLVDNLSRALENLLARFGLGLGEGLAGTGAGVGAGIQGTLTGVGKGLTALIIPAAVVVGAVVILGHAGGVASAVKGAKK